MAAEILFLPEAVDDVEQAAGWYEQRRPGLAEAFLTSLDACLAVLQRNPQLYPPQYKDFRRALLRRFPYAVFYKVDSVEVVVWAVLHTSRDPRIWEHRLK